MSRLVADDFGHHCEVGEFVAVEEHVFNFEDWVDVGSPDGNTLSTLPHEDKKLQKTIVFVASSLCRS